MIGTYLKIPEVMKSKLKSIATEKGFNFQSICIIAFEEFIKRNDKK